MDGKTKHHVKIKGIYIPSNIAIVGALSLVGAFTIFLIIMIILVRRNFKAAYKSIETFSNPCSISSLSLPDFSNVECCVINNDVQNIRYDSTSSIAVVPYQVWYVSACSGYCIDGVNISGETPACNSSAGQTQFEACTMKLKPNAGCNDLAKPYAQTNGRLNYLLSVTPGFCTTHICPRL